MCAVYVCATLCVCIGAVQEYYVVESSTKVAGRVLVCILLVCVLVCNT